MTERIIRASSLPTLQMCERMGVAGLFPDLLAAAGFEIPRRKSSIAAAIGTAVHAWIAKMLIRKRDEGVIHCEQDIPDDILAAFNEETAGGVEIDELSGGRREAQVQIRSIAKSFAYNILPYFQPLLIEQKFTADAGDGFVLSGHMDAQPVNRIIHDWKSGGAKVPKPFQSQMGGYSILTRSNGHDVADILRIVGIQRVSINRVQPDPVTVDYPREDCERLAESVIDRTKENVGRFEVSGNPYVFNANNSSVLCSKKYCPAWGTEFCTFGKE